ncbi:MAG: glycosyltransferase [bacterium]|nr:glycosyltransferase [bacterium]
MKLLCFLGALDFRYLYGCTSAWWQFMKGLHEEGCEIVAVPLQGDAFDTLWWRTYPNACALEASIFDRFKKRSEDNGTAEVSTTKNGWMGRALGFGVDVWYRPRWERHLTRILEKEKDVDAVLFFLIPLSLFSGVPERLRQRFGIPIINYDGDVPATLPAYGGFASGFDMYEEADVSEYDAVICNSEGGAEELLALGARRVGTVHWGVDPELYAPLDVDKEHDVFFYGYGQQFREERMRALISEPCERSPHRSFTLGGNGFHGLPSRITRLGNVSANALTRCCCASRVNLSIPRTPHATVRCSSSMRYFELAAMGCCMVSSPCNGLETWFDVGSEVLTVDNADSAVETYEALLTDDAQRKAMGAAARKRVIAQHTHRHRAREIMQFLRSL